MIRWRFAVVDDVRQQVEKMEVTTLAPSQEREVSAAATPRSYYLEFFLMFIMIWLTWFLQSRQGKPSRCCQWVLKRKSWHEAFAEHGGRRTRWRRKVNAHGPPSLSARSSELEANAEIRTGIEKVRQTVVHVRLGTRRNGRGEVLFGKQLYRSLNYLIFWIDRAVLPWTLASRSLKQRRNPLLFLMLPDTETSYQTWFSEQPRQTWPSSSSIPRLESLKPVSKVADKLENMLFLCVRLVNRYFSHSSKP